MNEDKSDMDMTILRLKLVKLELDIFLARGRAMVHNGMKQVGSGIWINEKFNSVGECLQSVGEVTGY